MDNFKKLVNVVREKKAIFIVLASLVVSITTYSMILPAFTLDEEEAKDQGGIDIEEQVEKTSAKDTETVENAKTQAAETEKVETKKESADEAHTIETKENGYGIVLSYDKDAKIPENAKLEADEIKDGKDFDELYDKAESAVKDAAGKDASKKISKIKLYDISIKADGKEIEPESTVDVSINYEKGMKLAGKDEKGSISIVHFTEDKNGKLKAELLDDKDYSTEIKNNTLKSCEFSAESFSVYAIIYTVDFHYDMNGKSYDYTIEGGSVLLLSDLLSGLGADIGIDTADIDKVTFSDPSLISITKKNNDFELKSLKPFNTEETLTVTLKNGDSFNIRVTDAQEIPDAEKVTLDASKSYLICYEINGTYYLLKNDGTVQSGYHPDFEGDPDAAHDFEHLNSTFCWSFNHIFKENDVEHHLDKNYYLIRPIDNKSRTLALNNAGEALVQQGNNNVAVIQNGDGFILEGYHNVGTEEEHRYIHLGFNNGAFAGVDGDGVKVHIYEMNSLPTYDYTVRSQDETRGTVSVSGGEQETETVDGKVLHYYKASSDHEKKERGDYNCSSGTAYESGSE